MLEHGRSFPLKFALAGIAICIIIYFCISNKYFILKNIDKKLPIYEVSTEQFDILIVGAGLSGAVLAERHASLGHRVLVIDKRPHIAGNCYDYIDEVSQLRISKYGAHLFHTNNDRVWEYVQQFAVWKRWEHRVLAMVDEQYVPVPVNIQTVNKLFRLNIASTEDMNKWLQTVQIQPNATLLPRNSEEMALSRVGRVLYEKIFSPYTQKQWNQKAVDLDPSVLSRIPIHNNFDDRYFTDKYQALPRDGYAAFVKSLLSNPLITTMLEVDYFDLKRARVPVYYTGPIDRFFGQDGLLEYRSLRFERLEYDTNGTVLPASVVNYPSLKYPYTRDVEYKHFLQQNSSKSVIFREYSVSEGEPYYPVPTQRNRDVYQKLISQTSKKHEKVTFVGRLANYKYFNMDEAIGNALKVFQQNYVVHIITTVFNEDISSWISHLCDLLPQQPVGWFVFSKHPNADLSSLRKSINTSLLRSDSGCNTTSITVIDHRQNVGREGLAWLEYMLNDVNHASYNVFLQGSPEVSMERVVKSIKLNRTFDPFHYTGCGDSMAVSQEWFENDFRNIVLDNLKLGRLCVSWRGEFATTATAIREMIKTRKELIENVFLPKLREGNDPGIGHVLERLWAEFFGYRRDTMTDWFPCKYIKRP